MNRLSLDSNEITSVGYNPRILALELEFADASLCHYFNVPNEVFEGLMGAECASEYFKAHIQNQFKSKKVT